jgi:hypothetical protein
MAYVRIIAGIGTAIVLGTVSVAQAQSLPSEGPLQVTFTGTQIPLVKPMPIGGGKEYVETDMAMSATNDLGNPVLNNMGGRCQVNTISDPSAKTAETHGYCTYTDANNDQIFEKCDFLPSAAKTCELTGGTGKFQGLRAQITITSMPLKSIYEGALQLVGHKKGTYKIVKGE